MAGVGKRFEFHGAFRSKREAVKHERKGEFILGRRIQGEKRFVLVSKRGK